MSNSKNLIDLLLIIAITFGIYMGTLNSGFVWLDHSQIERGECIIKNVTELKNAFIRPLLVTQGKGNYYRPLFKISYTIDYFIYGLNPRGFHFTNLILQVLNLILLYSILNLLGIERIAVLLSCVLYAILPLNVSSVACLVARADILSAFFILLSFFSFLKFEIGNKKRWYLFSLLGYFLALLTKEIAIGFLPLMWLWIYWKQKSKKYIFPYVGITILYLLGRYLILGRIGTRIPLLWGSPYSTLLSSCVGFFTYLLKSFLPYNLSISDAFPRYNSIFHPLVLVSLVVVCLFILAFLKFMSSKKIIPALALGWVLSFYIPISNLIPALHFWAERFFYVPEIGVIIFLAYVMDKKSWVRKIVILALPVFSIINLNYQRCFKNDFLLFQRALKVSKFSREAHTMLGYLYMEEGDYPQAVYHYTFALQDIPYYYTYVFKPEILNNLGVIYMRLGIYDKARFYFQQGLKLSPRNKELRFNLEFLKNLERPE